VIGALERDRERRCEEDSRSDVWARFTSLTSRERQIMALVTDRLVNKRVAGKSAGWSAMCCSQASQRCVERGFGRRERPHEAGAAGLNLNNEVANCGLETSRSDCSALRVDLQTRQQRDGGGLACQFVRSSIEPRSR
jgi:hypothetical protein